MFAELFRIEFVGNQEGEVRRSGRNFAAEATAYFEAGRA